MDEQAPIRASRKRQAGSNEIRAVRPYCGGGRKRVGGARECNRERNRQAVPDHANATVNLLAAGCNRENFGAVQGDAKARRVSQCNGETSHDRRRVPAEGTELTGPGSTKLRRLVPGSPMCWPRQASG